MKLKDLLRRRQRPKPLLSVIVIMYNMRREAERTLLSLSTQYQQGISQEEYEVIVIDNNSSEALDADRVQAFGPQFRYEFFETDSHSPVAAINHGARLARGNQLGIFIDGARILTPRVLRLARAAAAGFREPIVATLNWHLGPKMQNISIQEGYNQAVEDQMLRDAGWPDDPYVLHDISVLGGSTNSGYFADKAESNGLFVSRRLFDSLGGYDERFVTPGGGLVNLDFYRRACAEPGSELIVLLGEGTFHQIHGGVMTNAPVKEKESKWNQFDEEYRSIHGESFKRLQKPAFYLGGIPDQAIEGLKFSAAHAKPMLKKPAEQNS